MKRARTLVRVVFVLMIILLIVRINRKSENIKSIAKFKFEMLKKMQTDSLSYKDKTELLIDETTEFIDKSPEVKSGVGYLMPLLALFIVVELTFVILIKRNLARP